MSLIMRVAGMLSARRITERHYLRVLQHKHNFEIFKGNTQVGQMIPRFKENEMEGCHLDLEYRMTKEGQENVYSRRQTVHGIREATSATCFLLPIACDKSADRERTGSDGLKQRDEGTWLGDSHLAHSARPTPGARVCGTTA